MGRGLSNPNEMKLIYQTSKEVYEGKYAVAYALRMICGKVSGTKASVKMYFNIYSCMRDAKCYKMGTSEAFTKYLLNHIYQDEGIEAYLKALSAVKGNYTYRESVNNAQPGLIRACNESIEECGVNISYDDIPPASITYDKSISNHNNLLLQKLVEEASDMSNQLPDSTVKASDESNVSFSVMDKDGNATGDVLELNIQPPASILNVFSRLSYKPWYAIAEFVDNSTQSYISHSAELDSEPTFDKLVVKIKYDSQNNTLSVIDNAYGMEIDRFRDAILLDSRNETQTGRNEFGMGLKTAASWFGKVWKVTSTQYGSVNRYTATIDIPKIDELHLQGTKIYRDYVAKDLHGTEIIIEQVTKKINAPRTIGKIRDLLSSMYRRDINNKNIEIWFDDKPIEFENYPILNNYRGKSWKKDLDFVVDFDDKKYHVTGFVAIMNPGSFSKAGFALFRQDRVVIGGTDSNYKPARIFTQAQSQVSLKLFGELNMNDFPVNQAKDGFIWDDGLEDAFIEALTNNIQEYIEIAKKSKTERNDEMQYSDQASATVQQDVTETIDIAFDENNNINESNSLHDSEEQSTDRDTQDSAENTVSENSDLDEYINTVLNAEVKEEYISTVREYIVPLSHLITVHFSVRWARGGKRYWIEYTSDEDDKYDVQINIDHPFFMPFSKQDGFQKVLEKFAIAFILSEHQAKSVSDKQGYIQASTIKNYMNKYLEKLAEGE